MMASSESRWLTSVQIFNLLRILFLSSLLFNGSAFSWKDGQRLGSLNNGGSALKPPDMFRPQSNQFNGGNSPDTPRFLKTSPPLLYTTSGKPATVECIAAPATYMNIICAVTDNKRLLTTHETGPGKRYAMNMTVPEKVVEEWFAAFWCYCEAWNTDVSSPQGHLAITGNKTFIQLAFMDKRFLREPLSVNTRLGADIDLGCLPPEGHPKPSVYWLKNGIRIRSLDDPNYIVTAEGHLVIGQARLMDKGNYTCVAENVGGIVKLSEPASVNIFVNGGWTQFSPWSMCPSSCSTRQRCTHKCRVSKSYRKRLCNNPAPRNGGSDCLGQAVDSRPCDRNCIENGGWSKWSYWNDCGPDCVQTRRRFCNNPKPRNGGQNCGPFTEGIDHRNCTTTFCIQVLNKPEKKPPRSRFMARDIAMYVGLVIAVCVLLIVVFIIIYLARRRSLLFVNTSEILHYQIEGYPCNKEDEGSTKTRELLLPPDLTHSHLSKSLSTCQETVSRASDSKFLPLSPCAHPVGGLGLLFPPHSPPPPAPGYAGTSAQHFLDVKSYNGSSDEAGRSPSHYYQHPYQLHNMPPSSSVQSQSGLQSTAAVPPLAGSLQLGSPSTNHKRQDWGAAWGTLTSCGGRLGLPDYGISLTVPPGAVPPGYTEEIFVAINTEDKDFPKLQDGQTLLSSMIVCGPPYLQLSKPLILSFPHCAALKQGNWTVSVLSCDPSVTHDLPTWDEFLTVGDEYISTPGFCQLDEDTCHLMTQHLRSFCLIGSTGPTNTSAGGIISRAHKNLRLAAFAQPIGCRGHDFQIRVYVLNDTKDVFEGVVALETQNGGRLIETPKQLVFRDNGENLCFCIEELSMGWRSRLPSKYQEVPFGHLWSACQPGLHCAFSLEHVDTTRSDISCKILAYQNNGYSNRLQLRIACNVNQLSNFEGVSHANRQPPYVMSPPQNVFRMSQGVRRDMASLMDPPSNTGNDWRMLARHLEVERYMTFFATQQSPTEALLDLWEARNREETALSELRKILRSIGRPDAASLIDH